MDDRAWGRCTQGQTGHLDVDLRVHAAEIVHDAIQIELARSVDDVLTCGSAPTPSHQGGRRREEAVARQGRTRLLDLGVHQGIRLADLAQAVRHLGQL